MKKMKDTKLNQNYAMKRFAETRFGDCDCEDVVQLPSDEYECEECRNSVWICKECYIIIDGCGCGHCPDGAQFTESDY